MDTLIERRAADGASSGTPRGRKQSMPTGPARPRRAPAAWWSLLGLVILVAAAYGQTLWFDLVLDDHFLVVGNPVLRGRMGWWGVFTAPPSTYLGEMFGADRMYRPLLALTAAADRALWGMRPGAFHLSSVLAHLAVVLLVWRLGWWLTASRWAAFAAGALLAVHPSAVEAVAFVAARMDVFVGLGMAAVVLLLRRSMGPRGGWRVAGGLLCFALALGAKETALAIPPLLTWGAWVFPEWFAGPRAKVTRVGLAARVVPFWLLLGAYGVVRQGVMGSLAPVPLHWGDLPGQALRTLAGIATYAEMTLIPGPSTGFIVVGKVTPPGGISDGRVLLGLAVVVLLIGGLLWLRPHHPPAAFTLGGYAAALAPTSNVLPVHWEQAVYVAERSLYPALVFWCLFLAVAVHAVVAAAQARAPVSWALPRVMGVAVMGTLLAVTVVKVGAWRDDLSLWKASAAAHPDSTEIRLNLIAALAQAGDVQGADAVLRETAAGLPEDPHLAYLGGWLAQLGGEPAEALRQYERALSLGVGLARAFRDAALVAAQLHQWDRACHLFQAAAERSPRTAWPEVGLGWCRQRERRLDLAQAHFHRAARLEPASPERPAFLGQLLLAEGRRPEALSAFQAALALDPAHVPAHRAMALLLEQEGRVAEAMERWQSVAASLPPSYRGEALQHLRQLRATPARTASPAPQQDEPPSVPKPGGPGDRFGPR